MGSYTVHDIGTDTALYCFLQIPLNVLNNNHSCYCREQQLYYVIELYYVVLWFIHVGYNHGIRVYSCICSVVAEGGSEIVSSPRRSF